MDKIEKFLRKIDRAKRVRLLTVMALIQDDILNGLDIVSLKGLKNTFRCRIGDIRILFVRVDGKNVVQDMDFRGRIYKK